MGEDRDDYPPAGTSALNELMKIENRVEPDLYAPVSLDSRSSDFAGQNKTGEPRGSPVHDCVVDDA